MCGSRNTWVQLSVETRGLGSAGAGVQRQSRAAQPGCWELNSGSPWEHHAIVIERPLWSHQLLYPTDDPETPLGVWFTHGTEKTAIFIFNSSDQQKQQQRVCFVPSSPKGCMHANFKFVNLHGSEEVCLVKRLNKVHQVRIYHLQPVRLQQGNFFKSNFKHNRVRKRCGCQKISKGSITGCQLLP